MTWPRSKRCHAGPARRWLVARLRDAALPARLEPAVEGVLLVALAAANFWQHEADRQPRTQLRLRSDTASRLRQLDPLQPGFGAALGVLFQPALLPELCRRRRPRARSGHGCPSGHRASRSAASPSQGPWRCLGGALAAIPHRPDLQAAVAAQRHHLTRNSGSRRRQLAPTRAMRRKPQPTGSSCAARPRVSGEPKTAIGPRAAT